MLKQRPNYFNLVVSDIVMPIMDGYELVKNIKSNEAGTRSGHRPDFHGRKPEKVIAAGFDGYAMKTIRKTSSARWKVLVEE